MSTETPNESTPSPDEAVTPEPTTEAMSEAMSEASAEVTTDEDSALVAATDDHPVPETTTDAEATSEVSTDADAASEASTTDHTVPEPTTDEASTSRVGTDEDMTPEEPTTEAAPVEQEAAPDEQVPAPDEQGPAPDEQGPAPDEQDAAPAPTPRPTPRPAAPSPAALAARLAAVRPAAPVTVSDHSESARFGRVAEDGTVFVRSGADEVAVGSYPGATPDEALQYFARKYDELYGMTELLEQRITASAELGAKDAAEQLAHLAEQAAEPAFVGDLDALRARLDSIGALIEKRREDESAQRAAAKAAARAERETLVARAEAIAAQDPQRTQWKRSGEELRSLFDEWKSHQRSGARLDKPVEAELWHRFSAARSAFDKARRSHFSELEASQSEVKAVKERLVREAEQLSGSRDWGPTAREFKRLMDRWRAAGRAGRSDDDALWARFKAAQDAFFTAKDEVAAAENEEFRANLTVKEQLLVEAEGLLPVRDLEGAKAALRSIQDRWDKAGKVPRADIDRTEKGMRRVEQAVRDAEDRRWSSSNPEGRARAQSLVDQLERAVADLERDLEAAQTKGNEKKANEARAAIQGRQALLDQARSALTEFS